MSIPHNFMDLTGQKFGKLTVLKKHDVLNGKTRWLCQCDCGGTSISTTCNLKNGTARSCGCIRTERTSKLNLIHGETDSILYKKWRCMINRCKPNSIESKHYYDKKIRVCNEWGNYLEFKKWALENGYEEGYSIDRIDNSKGYEPSNCRWIPLRQQAWNKTTTLWIEFNGEKKSLAEWCSVLNLRYSKIYKRIHYRHWDIERAFTTP